MRRCATQGVMTWDEQLEHIVQEGRAAAQRPGVAASDGELEKILRYGLEVAPLAVETYGRMGPASIRCLRHAANAVGQHLHGLGRQPGRAMYSQWRYQLEATLLREIADVTLAALGQHSGLLGARRSGAGVGQGGRQVALPYNGPVA